MLEKTRRYAIECEGKTYAVLERVGSRRGMSLRLSKKEPDLFLLSVGPYYARRREEIDAFLRSAAPKLIARSSSRSRPYRDGKLYVLGKIREVGELDEEEVSATLKKIALPYFQTRAAYWKETMGVKEEFAVRVRDMKTRFGSNCFKTRRVVFATIAICYSPEIIDYLIIHELAHFTHPNHQEGFHRLVAKYDPAWKLHRNQLQKGIYDGNHHQLEQSPRQRINRPR